MGLCVILAFHVANLKYFISQIRNISEGVFKYSISQIKNISHASIYSRVLTFKWDTNDNIQLEHTQAHQSIKCAIAKISLLTNQKFFEKDNCSTLLKKSCKKMGNFFWNTSIERFTSPILWLLHVLLELWGVQTLETI